MNTATIPAKDNTQQTPLLPRMSAEELKELYVNGALCFAHSFLWKNSHWDDEQTMEALADLDLWFRRARDKEAAFITFCDRVVIGGILASFHHTTAKALWNCLVSTGGVPSNKDLETSHQKINGFRRKNPFLTKALPVLCRHYIHYLHQPSHKTIQSLSDTLNKLGFPHLMEPFYDALSSQTTVDKLDV
jgi:hypothetical protein